MLRQVPLEMLLADMMIGADDAAFEDGKVAFNRIGMGIATDVFSGSMIYGLMEAVFTTHLNHRAALVRHNESLGNDFLIENHRVLNYGLRGISVTTGRAEFLSRASRNRVPVRCD